MTDAAPISSPEPPGPALAAAVGRRLGVTGQTIRNWRKRGCPAAGTDDAGRDLFDVEAVRAWQKRNMTGGRGGRRPGAGRRLRNPHAGPTSPLERHAAENASQVEREKARIARARAELLEGRLGADTLILLASTPEDLGGASKAEIERLCLAVKAQKEQLELDKARGALVSAAETKAEWGSFLAALATRLDGLPARLCAALSGVADEAGRLAACRSVLVKLKAEILEEISKTGETDGPARGGVDAPA